MGDEEQVLAANAKFYGAFAAKDVDAMTALWARRAPVACIHPGWHALRGRDTPVGAGRPIAVNVDPTESDLSHLDPQDVVVAVTSATGQRSPSDFSAGTPRDQESRQKVWWYLLVVALLIMAGETALSNGLSKAAA